MPRIVVLDGYTLNPGDISWGPIEALGACTIHDRTPAETVWSRSREAGILLTNKTVLTGEVIRRLPELKYIGVLATGYNVVDLHAARERGVPVTHVPEYATEAVAQMVFAHLLNLCHRVAEHGIGVRQGVWSACRDFCYWEYTPVELRGLTMGIVGLGRIGKAVAALAPAFGMRVIAHHPGMKQTAGGIELTDLEDLFRRSDVVSLHCRLTEENRGFVNRDLLARMKPSAFLINTARGPLIDEQALADALNAGVLAGAGLDVLEREPPPEDGPLLTARNCYITPHIAWAARGARQRLLQTAADNIAAFLRGSPVHVVNAGC